MFFMLKHSLKSVVRTPGKSLLFMLLLSAAILFVSLGSSMLYSAERMLDQANEQFDTVVALKYGGLQNNQGAWADDTFQTNLRALDFAQLVDHPAVQGVDLEREIFAFAADATDIKQQASPFSDINVFTFKLIYQEANGVWSAVAQKSLFGDAVGDGILVRINPMSAEGVYVGGGLETERTYLSAAIITYAKGGRVATLLRPATLTDRLQAELSALSEFTDITDTPDYFDTPEGQLWQSLIQSMTVIDQSFSVTISSNLPIAAPFHLNQTRLVAGQFESADGSQLVAGDVCYISDRVAALLGLEVGDTWPLQFHYSPTGNPIYSYWEGEGFAYEGDIQIAGIFQEVSGMAFNVYMPFPEWVDKVPDDYEFLRILVDNPAVDDYTAYVENLLPENIAIQVEDQGYAAAVKPILTLREQALRLTAISVVAGVAVAVLFSYLFITRQRETAGVMMMLGTGRTKTGAYLLFGVLLIALLASLLGTLLAGMLDLRMTEIVWEALQQEPALDMRYSERALGIPTAFVPELATSAWVRWLSAGLLVLVIVTITLIFALLALRKPKRKKLRKSSAPNLKVGKAMSYAWAPTVSLRFALRSVRRNLLRSLMVPAAAFLLAVFIVSIGFAANRQQAQAEAVYDEVPTTAYMTTFLGESREIPLHLQSDIFHLLSPDYQARSTYQMAVEGMSGDQILALREAFEEDNPYIESVMLTSKMHYSFMGVVSDAAGNVVNPDLPRRPEVADHFSSFGYDWFEAVVNQMPVMLFTDSLLVSPEFSGTREPDIQWLEGYSDHSLRTTDTIAVLPDRFVEEHQIQLGDTVRIACYKVHPEGGILMEAYDFRVVGTYHQGSRSPVIYAPWSLTTYLPITFDSTYLALESPQEDEVPLEWLNSNEYLVDFLHTATLIPADTRDLAALRDYLEAQELSQVGTINRNRLAVVIEDKALTDALESIQQHIALMNLITPIMLALSAIIGFILSYLLTRNRLREFAIMRSLGTQPLQVYSAFFLEQVMLFLIGLAPVLIALALQPAWGAIFGRNLLWFILLYTLGIMIAIGLMGRSKVLDILFSKE